jgi:hypothetical protein
VCEEVRKLIGLILVAVVSLVVLLAPSYASDVIPVSQPGFKGHYLSGSYVVLVELEGMSVG